MVPEMNATMDAMSKVGVKEAVKVFLLQNIGIMSGIVSLFVLARFQDDILIQMWSVSVDLLFQGSSTSKFKMSVRLKLYMSNNVLDVC